MYCDTTDPELLRSLSDRGNGDAWGKFDEMYRPAILRHCRSVGLTLDQAEEVAQECFIKCSRYLPSFDYQVAIGRFRAWLNLTVNQQIADMFRQALRSERIKDAYAALLRDFAEAGPDSTVEPSAFEYELVTMAFRRTQAEVEPKSWQMFEAHVVHGMKSADVGRQLGVSAMVVRVYAHRVRGVLRRNWKVIQEGPF